jgi:hypothetical protein
MASGPEVVKVHLSVRGLEKFRPLRLDLTKAANEMLTIIESKLATGPMCPSDYDIEVTALSNGKKIVCSLEGDDFQEPWEDIAEFIGDNRLPGPSKKTEFHLTVGPPT